MTEPAAGWLTESQQVIWRDFLLAKTHIDDYLEGREIPAAEAEKLEGIWLRSRHKRTMPVGVHDDWWR